MARTEWPFTNLGVRFFSGTLPSLVENIGKLADELKRYNDKQDEQDGYGLCPKCGARTHQCETGDPGCLHCAECGWMKEPEHE